MILGIVNGGLGLWLAGETGRLKTAYIALAAIFSALYIASAVFGVFRRRKNTTRQPTAFKKNSNDSNENGHQPEVSQS